MPFQKHEIPEQWRSSVPKITKGENYKGLPYIVLDYPAFFSKEDTLALRIIFHWGNHISIHLHLAGRSWEKLNPVIIEHLQLLRQNDFYFCVNNNQWEHHFEKDNYISLSAFTNEDFRKINADRQFCKLAKKIPLQEWKNTNTFIAQATGEILSVIENRY